MPSHLVNNQIYINTMISSVDTANWTVVVSKGQSRNPEKRGLEEAIAQQAGQLDGVKVLVVPHLYDLPRTSESYKQLAEIEGDLIVISWIFPRAAHWVLDRNQIRGKYAELSSDEEEEEDDDEESEDTEKATEEEPKEPVERVIDMYPRPDRMIHCADLKSFSDPTKFLSEVKQIVGIEADPDLSLPIVGGKIVEVEEQTGRRWYPVIDFSRCTNCMECVDFCLFGVYGIDGAETILVEQPDNCRKGCPACSRVCPENAIIFPQHKAPAIAGALTEAGEGFKIDLSQLFGAPSKDDDQIDAAARERDEQLLLAGRDAIGIDDQLRLRQATANAGPKDQLDNLLDSLDELDL